MNPELQAGTLFAVVTLTGAGLVGTSPFTVSESSYNQEVYRGC